MKTRKSPSFMPPAAKGALLIEINNPERREEIQRDLLHDHMSALRILAERHGIRSGGMRRYLKASGYTVPSNQDPRPAPVAAQGSLPLGDAPAGLHDAVTRAINTHSAENASDTPDFILAGFLIDCLDAFNRATNARSQWQGVPTPLARIVVPTPAPQPAGQAVLDRVYGRFCLRCGLHESVCACTAGAAAAIAPGEQP